MENKQAGFKGRMEDFAFEVVKSEKTDSKKSEKDQKKKP